MGFLHLFSGGFPHFFCIKHFRRGLFQKVFAGVPSNKWQDHDVTEVYQAARRQVFEQCRRVVVHAQPGESYVVHRLALHGVAPFDVGAEVACEAPDEGRMIAYLRPELVDVSRWVTL